MIHLSPPFRRVWTFHGQALLEFPPAVAARRLYMPTFDGRFYALNSATGKTLWRYESGRCAWASPALGPEIVYQTFLNRKGSCDAQTSALGGNVVAFDRGHGTVRWKRHLGPTESSPLLYRGKIYVGDWLGRVYALDAQTGRVIWTRSTAGPVKASVAADGGRVYVGSYDGHLYAFDARRGQLIWRSSSALGHLYSTPAVAYGRVYVGSTDGRVYAVGAGNGELQWSYSTSGYVYSSPAVWRGSVLIGSYDAYFYALDAATGALRWRFRADGAISGSGTVLGHVVYFSTLKQRTYALDTRNGRQVWSWPDGKYSPVVADRHRLYLVGYGRLYGMVEG